MHGDAGDGVVDAVFGLLNALLHRGCAASEVLVTHHQTRESCVAACTAEQCEDEGVPELLLRAVVGGCTTRMQFHPQLESAWFQSAWFQPSNLKMCCPGFSKF